MSQKPHLLRSALLCTSLVIALAGLRGQGCTLTINPRVSLAIDQTGQALVTYPMVLEDVPSCAANLEVLIFNLGGGARPQPIITCADVGRSLRVTVRDRISGNSAMGRIDVYDHLGPTVTAVDVSVPCTLDPFAAADQLVSVLDNCTPASAIQVQTVSETISSVGCAAGIAQTITRVLMAIDAQGNLSAPVTQVISITRVDLLAVSFPGNLTLTTSATGLCPDELLALVPEEFPLVDGLALDASCKLLSTYTDVLLPGCGLSRKILRSYTVLDCCTNQIRRGTQLIQLLDDVAPGFTPLPDSVRATPSDNDCNYTALLPQINAADDCDASIFVRIRTPFGIINGNGGRIPRDFPLTSTPFSAIYEIRDGCGNVARDTLIVFAEDVTPPVAICNSATVIGITGEGTVIVARVFDAGMLVNGVFVPASYDNCSPVSFLVRRDTLQPFRSSIRFGCSDIGQLVTVELQVTDEAGNQNVCTVSAVVQSTIPPRITPPATFTAQCLDRPVDTSRSGVPSIFQNCPNYQLTGFVDDNTEVNVCGSGFTIRTFTITDAVGGTQTVTQRINYVDTFRVVVPTLPDINLPCEATLDVATLNPPQLGTPCLSYLREPVPVIRSSVTACGTVSIVEFNYTPRCGTEVITITQRVNQFDTSPPVFSTPAGSLDLTVACAGNLPSNLPVPVAFDNCTGANVMLVSDTILSAGLATCGNLLRRLTYVAVDGCGNANPIPFTVTILVDNQDPPSIRLLQDTIRIVCSSDLPPADVTALTLLSSDACGATPMVSVGLDVPDLNNTACQGGFSRVFTAVDACGNSAMAIQRIEYRDVTGPVLNPIVAGGTYSCYADLPNPNQALVTGIDGCDQTLTVTSIVTEPVTNTCRDTILRTYTVADACGNATSVTQTFFILDQTAPTLTVPNDRNTFSEENVCGRRINLTATAVDRCGSGPISFTNDSPYASQSNSASAAGFYPLDSTIVTFTATDVCGNANSASTVVYVADIVSPGFRCRPLYVYLDSSGLATVTDSTLLVRSQANDDCTPRDQLDLEVSLPRRTFTCADVGEAFAFTLAATDLFGNTGNCINNIIVDDTLGCPAGLSGTFAVRGRVYLPLYGRAAVEARVKISHPQGDTSYITDDNGNFRLTRVPTGQLSITAEVDLPMGYGMTSYDLLLANRHILGITPLQDPLKRLAADVNGSGSITGFDVTRMRRVILGLDPDFGPGSTSTLVLNGDHVFTDPQRPWLDRTSWQLAPMLDADLRDLQLAAIKLGDLNPEQTLLPRSDAVLLVVDREVRAGETVQIVVRNGPNAVAALQLGLLADGEMSVRSAEAELDVMANESQGITRVSVLSDVRSGAPTLEIYFKPSHDGVLSEMLSLSQDFPAEAYDAISLSTSTLALEFEKVRTTAANDLVAYPNPFGDAVTLSFQVTTPGEYHYRFTDLAGRGFAERRVTLQGVGRQNFVVSTESWAEGIYLLSVEGPDGRQTERLLLQR